MIKKIYALPLCILFACSVLAQSPGGVSSNLKLWLRADAAGTLTSTDSLNSWEYFNDNTKVFTATAPNRPILLASTVNFLPSVYFDGNKLMDGPTGVNAPIPALQDNYAVFGVWRASGSGPSRIWSQRNLNSSGSSSDGVSLSHYNNGGDFWGDQAEIFPFTHTWVRPFNLDSWMISQLNLLDESNPDDLEVIDQFNLTTPTTVNTIKGRVLSDVTNRLGARNGPGDEAFTGDLAELVVYDIDVSDVAVRNRIFSYFAVKYGISKVGDYVAADGTVFWDATANSAYSNAIFGIGQDDASSLFSTQSNSMVTGSGDGTGQAGLANIVISNPSDIDDVRFLMIGNNGGGLAESGSELPVAADVTSRRLPREWKVQHTGNIGTIDMSIDLNGITVTGVNPEDFRLMVDTDGDGDFATGVIRYYRPGVFAGGILNFNGVTLNNNEVFSVMTFALPVSLPVTWKGISAKVVNQNVVINWSVENNASGKNYEIEHSVDGAVFTTAGVIDNDVNVKSYSFTHANVANGKHFYRIHQVDVDGKATFSKIVDVTLKAPDFVISLLSNPVRNSFAEIIVNASKAANATIELWSLSGTRISILQQAVNAGINRVKVPMGAAAAGNYMMKVKVKDMVQTLQVSKL
jgi:hypothetical protein